MPTYVYEIFDPKNPDTEGTDRFEIVQRMSDSPLTKHPETGKPVRRVILVPHVAGEWSDSASKSKLSDKNLDRLGFTKYTRAGGGTFEKKAGKGPDVISAD